MLEWPRRLVRKARQSVPFNVAHLLLHMQQYDQLVIHKSSYRKIPPALLIPLTAGANRGTCKRPRELTILLVHNRDHQTLMERSLQYIGINDYTVLRVKPKGAWRNTIKLTAVLDYLKSGACRTEFILYCDCDDAVMRDDPQRAVDLLRAESSELLFSATAFDQYRLMPEARRWASDVAQLNGCAPTQRDIHMNTGVFVGRADFLREVLQEAIRYVTDDDLPRERRRTIKTDQELAAMCPDFPRGVGCDQTILRYLHRRFHPRMKIDYQQRLALR